MIAEKWHTVLGVNYIKDEAVFTEDVDFTIVDPYANVVYVSDFGLNLNAGARLNNHSEYGNHFVYNVNPSYVFATANGNVRKNSLEDFVNINNSGKIAMKLNQDDKIIGVKICKEDQDILLSTKFGKSIRFKSKKLRLFKGRSSKGIKGIQLSDNDKVISLDTSAADGAVVAPKKHKLKKGKPKLLRLANRLLPSSCTTASTTQSMTCAPTWGPLWRPAILMFSR